MEIKTTKSHQLAVLNEFYKDIDINIFTDIIFGEKIILFTNYDYDFYKICKDRFGKPRNNYYSDHIDIIFETELIIIKITAELIAYKF